MLPGPARDSASGAPTLGDPNARAEFWLRVLYSRCFSATLLCGALAAMPEFGPRRIAIAIFFALSSAAQNTFLYRVIRRTGVLPRAVAVSDYGFAVLTAFLLPSVFPWVLVILAATTALNVVGHQRRFNYQLIAGSALPFLAVCLWFEPEGWFTAYVIWLVCSVSCVAIIGRVADEERALRARYSQLIGELDVIVWEAPYGKPTSYVNDAVTGMLGYSPDEWCTPGRWARSVHPADAAVIETARRHTASGVDHDLEYRIRASDGSFVWVLELVRFTRDDEGAPLTARGVLIDISVRKQAEQRAGQLATLVHELPTSLQILRRVDDGDTDSGGFAVVAANRKATVELGRSEEELLGLDSAEVAAWLETTGLSARVDEAMAQNRVIEIEETLRVDRLGRGRSFRFHLVPLAERAIGVASEDVTERVRAAEALRRQALHDPLTGLANRTLLHDRVSAALRESRVSGAQVALLMMDLNQFKEVNDALGHHHGDRLLVALARRLSAIARDGDTPARLGGDEFALLLAGDTSPEHARETADTIMDAFAQPVVIDGIALQTNVSVGISCAPQHGTDPELLTQRADIAMYRAKGMGLGAAVYVPEEDRSSVRRLTLITDLRTAVGRGELVAHYQPRIDLRTGDVIDVEALVRWNHPVEGLLMPGEFIELAEVSGEILGLTTEMLSQSCRDIRSVGGPRDIGAAVNLSVRNLYDPNLSDTIDRILSRSSFPASRLRLEITESELMEDPRLARQVLSTLCDRGVRLSVDDFGTGYSSLSYLRALPVDELKIDRSFVADLEQGDSTLVRSIIELGHNLGLQVVAEGVESGPVLRQLADLGCDSAQGYFVSPPLPLEALVQFLERDGDHYRGWLRRVGAPDYPPVTSAT